jgi:benzoyl-CoA 2,3-epoxidase subunit B
MSLSESAFDPLSRTTRFMLTEESFHMFVGESGISRILERTCQLMKDAGYSDDVRKLGGIDLPTIQRFLNVWFSVSVDLHGSEVSSNAATYFANGLKGRAKEDGFDEHKALHEHYHVEFYEDETFTTHAVPMRQAMNEVLRDWYVGDCAAGVARWNRVMERHGIPDRLKLPSRRFHREIGIYAGFHFDPDGNPISKETWEARRDEWLPTEADRAFVKNLMTRPVFEPGKFANWIAPAPKGINRLPVDFEYVRTEG